MTGITIMRRYAVLVIAGCQIAGAATAAQPDAPPSPSSESDVPPPVFGKPPVAMEDPLPGDHWVYEYRDDIMGAVTATRQFTVTEATPKDITVRLTKLGLPGEIDAIFDRTWNIIDRGDGRYTPNSGDGIRPPLVVGKTWTSKCTLVVTKNGTSSTATHANTSKVVAQESVTTKAGTFDTFKIETSTAIVNVADPSRTTKLITTTWYAPAIDHWPKRTYVTYVNGHLAQSTSYVLVSYGRRQADPPASDAAP